MSFCWLIQIFLVIKAVFLQQEQNLQFQALLLYVPPGIDLIFATWTELKEENKQTLVSEFR